MKIVELPTPQKEADASVIMCLEKMLALAKSGDIISVAAAVVYRDRNTGSFGSATECFSAQLGALVMLQHDMIADQRELMTPRPIPEPPPDIAS